MPGYALNIDPLPTVSPAGAPGGDFENIQATPEMFGAPVARALQGLGQGAETAANTGLDALREQRQMEDRTHGAELHTWFSDKATDATERFLETKGRAAVDGLQAHKATLNDLFGQALAQAKDPYTKLLLQQETRRTMDYQYELAARHAAQQGAAWRSTTAKLASESAGDQAVLYATNGEFDAAQRELSVAEQVRRSYGAQEGLSGAPLDEAVRQHRGHYVAQIVEGIARKPGPDGGAEKANDFYQSQQGTIDAASRTRIDGFLHGELSRLHGERVTDMVFAEAHGLAPGMAAVRSDAAKALGEQGVPLNVTSAYRSPEHNRDVGGARFSQHLGGNAIDVSLDGLSAAQQQSVVDQFLSDPRVGGFGYYPNSKSIHVDVRGGTRTAWGSDRTHDTIGVGWPGWLTQRVGEWQGSAAPRQDAAGEGVPLTDRAGIYNRVIAETNGDPVAQAHAITRMNQRFAVEREERTQGLALFNRRRDDTLMEATVTGGVRQPLTEDDFVAHRKPGQSEDEARDDYQSYQADVRNGIERHTMEGMTSADMRAIVEAAEPAPDSPGGMTRAVQRQAFLAKSMGEIETKRRDDPAGAVGKSPAVVMALKQFDPQKPETYRSVADASLSAQEQLGIPAAYQSPIPKDVALQMTAPIFRALPGQEADAVRDAAAKMEKMFGPNAAQALGYALRTHSEDSAVKEAAARVVSQWIKGESVAPTEARAADQHGEVAAADAAVNAGLPRRPAPAQPSPEAQYVAHAPGRGLSEEDIANIEREARLREYQGAGEQEDREMGVRGTAAGLAGTRARGEAIAQPGAEREAVMARARARQATEAFQGEMDDLASREASLRKRALPTPEARHAAGQRQSATDTELAAIQSRRNVLLAQERQRLGIRTAGASSWPVDKAFPAADDVVALMHNPTLADKFDAQYGPGAARRILGYGEDVAHGG